MNAEPNFWYITLIVIICWIIGYIINRILVWIGAISGKWCDIVIKHGKYWWPKYYTIGDLYNDITYINPTEIDSNIYSFGTFYRWAPGFNIFIAIILFSGAIIKFILTLILIICRILYILIIFLWNKFIKNIYNFFKKIFRKIKFKNLFKIINFIIIYIIHIKNKIKNIRIA